MNDNDRMPWGKHKGTRLGNVPTRYLGWLLDQHFMAFFDELSRYIENRLGRKSNRKPYVNNKPPLPPSDWVTGEFYDPLANDGTCPFDPD
jgi:hypothetical protein